MFQNENVELTKSNYEVLTEKTFITSPADVDTQKSQATGCRSSG